MDKGKAAVSLTSESCLSCLKHMDHLSQAGVINLIIAFPRIHLTLCEGFTPRVCDGDGGEGGFDHICIHGPSAQGALVRVSVICSHGCACSEGIPYLRRTELAEQLLST